MIYGRTQNYNVVNVKIKFSEIEVAFHCYSYKKTNYVLISSDNFKYILFQG